MPHTHVAIVGSGFSGLGTAIRLKQEGIDDFVILERAGDVGGTWRDNGYPGCACDVQSHLYSFSFAPNPDWSHSYSPQPEIQAYLQRCARAYGLAPHLRLHHEVRQAAWSDDAQRWTIETARGTWTADVLVMASGALSDPAIPALPGLATFEGTVFHSAAWDHAFDLSAKRVAVIGTGASAIQFVPAIQPAVARLHVFQRTPPWILPRHDRPLRRWERRLLRAVPPARRALRAAIYAFRELFVLGFRSTRVARLVQRAALRHLRAQVPDERLRAKLTPAYTIGCKRILISSDYYPALLQPNVEVVTEGIAEVRPHAVVARDGTVREVDAIIFGTGFQPTTPPLARHVVGREGRTLAECWGDSMRAYAGTTVAGFPNLFVIPGPNTGLGHTSVVYMSEAQVEHVVAVLGEMRARGAGAVEPTRQAEERWTRAVDARMTGTVWVAGGCRSWYLDRSGRNSTLWPDFTWRYRRAVMRLVPEDYEWTPAREREPRRASAAAERVGARATTSARASASTGARQA